MSDKAFEAIDEHLLTGLELAEPDCVAEDFGGEVVVLNSATGVYHSLTDLAAAVWRDLMAGHSVEALLDAISHVDERAFQATGDFMRDLESAGLVRRTSSRAPRSLTPDCASLVGAGETKLTIQSFDDMKDLILADPIHDVDDEKGWPILRNSGHR
jgi:Coenzyme PQQ synthesis protein D (PqqD)